MNFYVGLYCGCPGDVRGAPAAGACEICHEIPNHPLLSQGTVSRWLHEKTKRHGLKSLIQNGPTFAQNPCTSCAHWIR